MYAGQKLTFRMRAADPLTRRLVTDADGVAWFFAPGTSPLAGDPPVAELPLTWDQETRYYTGHVDTAGWAAGTWRAQGSISGGAGGYQAWEYTTFPLEAPPG